MALIFFGCTVGLFAQNSSDTITITKSFGTLYLQKGQRLTPGQLLSITKSNQAAYEEMKTAKTNYDIGTVLSFSGGFMVGWPIGTALGGGDPNWALAGIGAALIVASIPLSTAYKKHATKAVRIYNRSVTNTGYRKRHIHIGPATKGIGLALRF